MASRRMLASVPLPPQTAPNSGGYNDNFIAINPVLEFTTRHHPKLYVDLAQPAQAIQEPPKYQGCLVQPATFPQLPSMAIVSEFMPRPIIVQRSSIDPRCVTVADVLGTLCEVMGKVVEEGYDPMRNAYHNGGGVWGPGSSRMGGGRTRRILDYLQGMHRFMGLSHSGIGPETFILNVGPI